MTYYNENDPKAAAWLRELIKAQLIPAGHVDTRSICDVSPHDLTGYSQQHFFAGIGGWPYALRLAGWPDSRPIRTGSCPCQPFSQAGKGAGEADERHLWPVFRDLITFGEPTITFGEQVASKAGRQWLARVRADLEGLGYAVGCADLCAACVGAPHIRQRLFWMAHSDCNVRGAGRGCKSSDARISALESPGRSDANGLAHSASGGQRIDGRASRSAGHTDQRSATDGLGNPDGDRRTAWLTAGARDGHGNSVVADGGVCGMADPNDHRRAQHEHQPGERPTSAADHAAKRARSRGLGDAELTRLEGLREHGDDRDQPGRLDPQPQGPATAAGIAGAHTHSRQLPAYSRCAFWDLFDLVHCTDGKARRIEPGTFPLADGVPGRVGLLRGYGNAIVPEVAEQFILSCLESL